MSTSTVEKAPLTRGHKKKARTRAQLLEAALEVLAERGEGFSIGDVAVRAGVSHGTFYNYFADRDALHAALGAHVVETFSAVAAREIDDPDPARRFALISARALASALTVPTTVRVALRLEVAQRALLDGALSYLRQDIVDGAKVGRFSEVPDDATIDVLLGALLLATRRVLDGDVDAGYRVAVIRRLLMSLGVERVEASRLATDAVAASSTASS
ncbi:MAG: TetR/AcrR family transcriptional regulator [Ilumatobacteraceae bacterium]